MNTMKELLRVTPEPVRMRSTRANESCCHSSDRLTKFVFSKKVLLVVTSQVVELELIARVELLVDVTTEISHVVCCSHHRGSEALVNDSSAS